MSTTEPQISQVPRSKDEAKAAYDKMSRWYDTLAGSSERKFVQLGLGQLAATEGERTWLTAAFSPCSAFSRVRAKKVTRGTAVVKSAPLPPPTMPLAPRTTT